MLTTNLGRCVHLPPSAAYCLSFGPVLANRVRVMQPKSFAYIGGVRMKRIKAKK